MSVMASVSTDGTIDSPVQLLYWFLVELNFYQIQIGPMQYPNPYHQLW